MVTVGHAQALRIFRASSLIPESCAKVESDTDETYVTSGLEACFDPLKQENKEFIE